MGKVLAMNSRRVLAALLVLGLVPGCGSRLAQVATASALGAKPGQAPQVVPIDSRVQSLTLESRKVKFPVVPISQTGEVTVWAAADGAQVALRDGVMIWTRGYGMDLMSADAPSVGALAKAGGQHGRVYHWLDGTDQPVHKSYTCSVKQVPYDRGAVGDRHFVESCTATGATVSAPVQNDFIINRAGRIIEARQWVSPMVGVLYLEPA